MQIGQGCDKSDLSLYIRVMSDLFKKNFLFFLFPLFGISLLYSTTLQDVAFLPRIVALYFWIIIAMVWIVYKKEGTVFVGSSLKNPAGLFICLWFIGALLSGINAINKIEFLASLQAIFAFLCLFFCFGHFIKDSGKFDIRIFLKAIIVFCLFLIGVGFVQFVTNTSKITSSGMMSVIGLMTNKNLFSEYLALCFPFLIVGTILFKGIWKWLSVISVILVFTGTMMLLTRSVWVAELITMIFISILLLVKYKQFLAAYISKKSVVILLSAFLIIVVLFSLTEVGRDTVFGRRFLSIFEARESAGGRLKIWSITLQIIQQHLFLGSGAGNWKIVFESFPLTDLDSVFIAEPLNDYLGIFAENGILGILGYCGMIFWAMGTLVKKCFQKENINPGFDFAVLSSLSLFSIISFFSFPKDRIEHMILFAFILAYASKDSISNVTASRFRQGNKILFLVIGILLCGLWFGIGRFQSEQHLTKAILAKNNEEWGLVVREVNKCNLDLYSLDPTTTPAVWYRGVAYYSLGETDKAFVDFKKAYQENPYHLHVINNLATCYALNGNKEEALDYYNKVLKIKPYFWDAVFNKAVLLYQLKKYDEAINFLSSEKIKNHPKSKEFMRIIKQEQVDLGL